MTAPSLVTRAPGQLSAPLLPGQGPCEFPEPLREQIPLGLINLPDSFREILYPDRRRGLVPSSPVSEWESGRRQSPLKSAFWKQGFTHSAPFGEAAQADWLFAAVSGAPLREALYRPVGLHYT